MKLPRKKEDRDRLRDPVLVNCHANSLALAFPSAGHPIVGFSRVTTAIIITRTEIDN